MNSRPLKVEAWPEQSVSQSPVTFSLKKIPSEDYTGGFPYSNTHSGIVINVLENMKINPFDHPTNRTGFSEIANQFLDILTVLEETEYWQLVAHKKIFLLKFLVDRSLDTNIIRKNLGESKTKLAKKFLGIDAVGRIYWGSRYFEHHKNSTCEITLSSGHDGAHATSSTGFSEIVEATLALETMIKTEYINHTWWWYWSSVSVAAKTSTIASLALRIYTLDAAIKYQKSSTTFDERHSRKMKQTSEKAKKAKEHEEQVERTDKG
ncbi:hypothetical protein L1987_43851 [Smallanthus sonchifolius]|uniref:Uncharacterized protein n=1 Tax=Smallanthus sonchifolius TaxID=185202 RepID=A0ACB9GNG4_9ASTR|nr:hypothetical protein L1987_43851 [Smallanthus sonchifolius]